MATTQKRPGGGGGETSTPRLEVPLSPKVPSREESSPQNTRLEGRQAKRTRPALESKRTAFVLGVEASTISLVEGPVEP